MTLLLVRSTDNVVTVSNSDQTPTPGPAATPPYDASTK